LKGGNEVGACASFFARPRATEAHNYPTICSSPPAGTHDCNVDRGRAQARVVLASRRPLAIDEASYSCNCRSARSDLHQASEESVLTRFRSFARRAAPWYDRDRRSVDDLRSERNVSVLARYIATCRGRTTLAVRRDDRRSARLTLYCRATTR